MIRNRIGTSLAAIVIAVTSGAVGMAPAHATGGSDCNSPTGINATPFASGLGTALDPYLISNVDQLGELHDCLASDLHFKLTDNIDAMGQSTSWDPIGSTASNDPTGFAGSLDGNNHTIYNIYVSSLDEQVGFFGTLSAGATITHIGFAGSVWGPSVTGLVAGVAHGATLNDVNVAGDATGFIVVGGLIGSADQGTQLTHITVNPLDPGSSVKGVASNQVGGIVGVYSGGTGNSILMDDLYSSIDVAIANGVNNLGTTVGGLFGTLSNAQITNSESDGNVSAGVTSDVGGLIGRALNVSVATSTSLGDVSGGQVVGGLIGTAVDNVSVDQSYVQASVYSGTAGSIAAGLVGGLCWDHMVGGRDGGCSITDSMFQGDVSGSTVSGLVGMAHVISNVFVARSYADASFNDVSTSAFGFAQADNVNASVPVQNVGNFWNSTKGQADAPDPVLNDVGVSSATIRKAKTFISAGWDIQQGWSSSKIWGICKGISGGTPFLTWNYDADPCSDQTLGTAFFTAGKSTLTPAGKKILNGVINTIDDQRFRTIKINGYASLNGKSSKPKLKAATILSAARATAVKTYIAAALTKRHVPAPTYMVTSMGATSPVASNKTVAGRAKNDRTIIVGH